MPDFTKQELYLLENVFSKMFVNKSTFKTELPKEAYDLINFNDQNMVRTFKKLCKDYQVEINPAFMVKKSPSIFASVEEEEKRLKEERPTKVRNFEFGTMSGFGESHNDIPAIAELEYDKQDNLIFKNIKELEEYLEHEFIPKHIKEVYTLNKETNRRELTKSIQLNKLVALQLSDDEMLFALEYLQDKNILVRGKDSSLDGVIDNYVFVTNYKNTELEAAAKTNWPEVYQLFVDYKNLREQYQKAQDEDVKKTLQVAIKSLRAKLVEANRRLVDVFIAKYYYTNEIPVDDVKQMAYLLLHSFVDKFDVDRGFRFSTFLWRYLPLGLSRMIKEERLIRLPVHTLEKIAKVEKVYNVLKELKNPVTPYDIAIELDMRPEEVEELLKYRQEQNISSLSDYEQYWLYDEEDPLDVHEDEYIGNAKDPEMDFFTAEYDMNEEAMDYDLLYKALNTLTPREEKVLQLRYGLKDNSPKDNNPEDNNPEDNNPEDNRPMTLDEISKVLGVTRERIRQIERKALMKLRHPSRSANLKGLVR